MNEKGVEKEIAQVQMGGSFGDLALIRTEPRSASIRCSSEGPVELIKIDKDSYDRILKREAAAFLHHKVEFLSSLSMFSHWSREALTRYSAQFEVKTLPADKIIVKEGDESDSVFFIVA